MEIYSTHNRFGETPSSQTTLTIPASNDQQQNNQTTSSSSAPSSPTKSPIGFQDFINKDGGTSGGGGKRTVKFPEDHSIVTGYHEAPDPFATADQEEDDQDLDTIIDAFKDACAKQNIEPIPSVLEQIKNFKSIRVRAQDLILRGQKLDPHQCEVLEEIFKRVLFRLIDLDSCDLDCDGASALFDMIEFYESASHLSIANNKSIGIIGWQALCRTLKKTSCLQYLDLSNTGLNEQILLFMGRTIRVGSHLVTLHLENANLSGRRLAILVSSIKFNTSLRELYLGENKISSADCVQIGNLLRGNSILNVLDLRNNFIQDTGLDHICEGLQHQPLSAPSTSMFSLFDPSKSLSPNLMSQNAGILILNLSNNQLTNRAMNRLSQTLSQCRSLIGLDLSYNSLGDEGILILKEGLLQSKTLKYLNLSSTFISNEGAIIIADILRNSKNLTIIDLSLNDVDLDGVIAIRDSLRLNKQHHLTRLIYQPQNNNQHLQNNIKQLFDEIDSYLNEHHHCRHNEPIDEFDSILNGFLRSDISVYQEIEIDLDENKENDNNNNDNFYTCDTTTTTATNVNDDNDNDNDSGSKKAFLSRTSSLGSWERPVKSGRFSVSPVDKENDQTNSSTSNTTSIQIKIEQDQSENSMLNNRQQQPTILENSSDDNEDGSDLSEQETDMLPELPTCFMKNKNRLLQPPSTKSRSFRRMSSPAISVAGLVKPPKPKHNLTLKLSGNLESLDLKSSLPLSPTFFAKFDFSDISLLRLPADVEEIVSNIDYSITDDIIEQFEKFYYEKPSKHTKQQQQQQPQCVC
uniref:Protein phosphatase 1 regulatory subunit 37-like n=1 Tax=Dermatophagoides pteronyssinus TaxID=6956 RepID=A0A6P6YC91_DERPT|nr:protein phosphatase 1 regulatory subunit 37-like [Dermatophagoides pteronyssinus]